MNLMLAVLAEETHFEISFSGPWFIFIIWFIFHSCLNVKALFLLLPLKFSFSDVGSEARRALKEVTGLQLISASIDMKVTKSINFGKSRV